MCPGNKFSCSERKLMPLAKRRLPTARPMAVLPTTRRAFNPRKVTTYPPPERFRVKPL